MSGIATRLAGRTTATARGIGFMCVSAFASSSMNGLIRLATVEIHPFEVAFFRNLFGLVVLLPVLLRNGLIRTLSTRRLPLHALRGCFNTGAMLLFFYALLTTPLAEVAALSFTAPLFATLMAMIVLKERVGLQRWTGLGVGFIGALVVIQPGVGTVQFGALLILASSAMWACAMICIKLLGRTESSLTTTTYAGLFMTPATSLCAVFFWTWPDPWMLLLLLAIGGCGSIGQMSIAQAFRDAEVSLVVPFDFTKLIWASLIGYWFFAEVPKLMTLVGGTIIITAVSFIAYRENRLASAKR